MKNHGVLDFGNSAIKLAIFSNGELEKYLVFDYSKKDDFHEFIQIYKDVNFILSSVIDDDLLNKFIGQYPNLFKIRNLQLPVAIEYNSVESLGEDRIANGVALKHFAKGKNALCIDIGTCVKFDFKNSDDIFVGGSISPGIRLRYEALHHFTGKLPLLNFTDKTPLIGSSSKTSINSGVMNGITAEINGMMSAYEVQYSDLTIFMTGGDLDKLDLDRKNTIFADAHFTLKGLQLILEHNAL